LVDDAVTGYKIEDGAVELSVETRAGHLLQLNQPVPVKQRQNVMEEK
jgi:hypothetical protein